MTWEYQDATPRKQCTLCGKLKPLDHFPLEANGKGKATHRSRCKPCKNKTQAMQRKASRQRAKQQALIDLSKRQEEIAKQDRVPSRTLVYYWDQTYKPEPYYVRNDGLKHIPSRGV